jgi:hypothetical protein
MDFFDELKKSPVTARVTGLFFFLFTALPTQKSGIKAEWVGPVKIYAQNCLQAPAE